MASGACAVVERVAGRERAKRVSARRRGRLAVGRAAPPSAAVRALASVPLARRLPIDTPTAVRVRSWASATVASVTGGAICGRRVIAAVDFKWRTGSAAIAAVVTGADGVSVPLRNDR